MRVVELMDSGRLMELLVTQSRLETAGCHLCMRLTRGGQPERVLRLTSFNLLLLRFGET